MAAILILYISYPYIYSFMYGSKDAQTGLADGTNEAPLLKMELFIALRTVALLALALFWFWMFHKYNVALFNTIEIFLGRVPAFIIGVYIGHLAFAKVRIPLPAVLAALICAAVFCYIFNPLSGWSWSKWWWRLLFPVGGVLAALVLSWLFALLSRFSAWGKSAARFLRFSGALSLELYISHVLLFWSGGLLPAVDGNLGIMAAYIIAAYVISWAVAKLIKWVPSRMHRAMG